jgi:hypothetical protein
MKIRVPSHESSADIAGICTVTTGLNALSHHLHHVTIKASSGAVFALAQAIETGFDARLKLRLMRLGRCHNLTPKGNNKGTEAQRLKRSSWLLR